MSIYSTPNLTFRKIGLTPNDPNAAVQNLVNLNIALLAQASLRPLPEGGTGPIYGLSEIYYIAQPNIGDPGDRAIFLNSNNHVICLPGCRIVRPYAFDSGALGVLSGGARDAQGGRIFNARWIGGEFVCLPDPLTGEYAPGHVIRIIGDDILLQDIIVNGFGAADTATERRGGIAMALLGDRIRVVNPRVVNPYPQNGAGIRLFGGDGRRVAYKRRVKRHRRRSGQDVRDKGVRAALAHQSGEA